MICNKTYISHMYVLCVCEGVGGAIKLARYDRQKQLRVWCLAQKHLSILGGQSKLLYREGAGRHDGPQRHAQSANLNMLKGFKGLQRAAHQVKPSTENEASTGIHLATRPATLRPSREHIFSSLCLSFTLHLGLPLVLSAAV